MFEIKLITGTSNNYYFFKEEILKIYENGNPESFIYLLPVNRAVRYFKQQLNSDLPLKGLIDPPIFTFNSLIRKIFTELHQRTKIISNNMRILILNSILSSANTDLKFTNHKSELSRSIIRKIDTVLNELKEFGYTPELSKNTNFTSILKLSDFDILIKKINEFYKASQFTLIDDCSLPAITVADLDKNVFRSLFPKVKKIYINGYGIYTPPMLEFIRKAKSICDVEILLEYNHSNPEIFQNTQNAFDALSDMAEVKQSIQKAPNGIENHMFKFNSGIKNKIDLKDKISVQTAQNREQEMCMIAAKIKNLHVNKDVPLHKIGITFPNLESYFSTIKSVFNEYDIPVNISTGYPLFNSYLIKSYIQVLKIIMSGFSVSEIFKLFLSPFYKSNAPFNFNDFKKIAVRLRLTHLRGDWQNLFDNLYEHNKNDYFSKISQESIKSFKNELLRFTEDLSILHDDLTVKDFYDNYLNVLKKLGLFIGKETLSNALSIKETEKEFRAFNKFIQLIDQLKWMLELTYKNQKYSIKEFFNFIGLIAEEATYNLREWPNFGVQVMPRLEIQSTEPDYLFVGGLVEGDFPRKFTRDIFFNDEERAILGLNASEDLLSQDRFLFFQILSSNAKEILLSYPQFHGESVQVPSGFISNLKKVCLINNKEIAVNDSYLSKKKIIEDIGRKLHSGLKEKDVENFQIWSQNHSNDKTSFLLDNIDILLKKRKRNTFTVFEGNLTNNQYARNAIKKHFNDLSFSITALESFAFCPMQFFMQRVLNIEDDEKIESTMTALERGSLIHDILFKFFIQLKSQKLHKEPWNHFGLLQDIAYQQFDAMRYKGLLWELEKETYFGNDAQPGLWKRFLQEEEKEIKKSGFKPLLFETKFGNYSSSKSKYKPIPFVIKNQTRQISLTGKIDRIDVDDSGNTIIYDYKTGRSGFNIKFDDIMNGLSLQLPVYLAAAHEAFNKLKFNMEAIAAGYYLVKDSENCQRKTIFADTEKKPDIKVSRYGGKFPIKNISEGQNEFGIDQLIEQTKDYISKYVENLFNGNFRHTRFPNNVQCSSYCTYKMVCRKDVGKILAKKNEN